MNKIHKLFLFEGLNEHGVTSLASDIKERLLQEGRSVKHYQEGMSHPADMSMHAYLTKEEYWEFLRDAVEILNSDKCITKEELLERIDEQTRIEDGHAIIAYQQIAFPSSDYDMLLADLASREVYDGKLSYQEFRSLHLKRWKHFCKDSLNQPNTVYLFEHSLFKNHIQELMGFYDMEDSAILAHLSSLIQQVLPLNPVLYYKLPAPPYAYLARMKSEGPSFYKAFLSYVAGTNYGRLHGLRGMDGACLFLKNRLRIERLALEALSDTIPDLKILYFNAECPGCSHDFFDTPTTHR